MVQISWLWGLDKINPERVRGEPMMAENRAGNQ